MSETQLLYWYGISLKCACIGARSNINFAHPDSRVFYRKRKNYHLLKLELYNNNVFENL